MGPMGVEMEENMKVFGDTEGEEGLKFTYLEGSTNIEVSWDGVVYDVCFT